MGNCNSSDSTSVVTAKLISHDGRLQQFSYPVKVSYALLKNPACCICDSDELEFDDVVSAIDEGEELQLGHIYFALPLSKLKHPLQAEEMAALALQASTALTKTEESDYCGCRRTSVAPVIVPSRELKTSASRGAQIGSTSCPSGKVGRKNRTMATLSSIPE